MTRTWLWLASGLALAGCSRSSDRGSSGGDIPIESLGEAQAEAICDVLFRCEGVDDDRIKLVFRDAATCREYLSQMLDTSRIEALERAVAEGTVVYDSHAAARCVGTVDSGCGAVVSGFDGRGDCDVVFTGTVAEGGDCFLTTECRPGLSCSFETETCPGRCVTESPSPGYCGGVSCDVAAGEECFYPPGVGEERCVTEIVEPDATEGMPCGLVAETETQVTRRACAPGLYCTGDAYTVGTCRTPIAAGATCSDSDVCVSGHLCADGSCREVTIVRTAGGTCGGALLQVCDPLERLECVSEVCAEIGDGTAGSPCRNGDFGELTCNEGLVCEADTRTCVAPKPAGASCGSSRECASGSCDYTTSTCRDRYCDL